MLHQVWKMKDDNMMMTKILTHYSEQDETTCMMETIVALYFIK